MNTHITNIKGNWQEIQDASGYSVNRDGQIRNDKTGKILKPFGSRGKYLGVGLGRAGYRRVHRRVDFIGDPNIQNLIDTMRKRLCSQADPETREYAEDFKAALHEVQPEISDVLVPNCVYRCGCPEMQTCGLYESWSRLRPEVMSTCIQHRYDIYNSMFWKARAKRGNDTGD